METLFRFPSAFVELRPTMYELYQTAFSGVNFVYSLLLCTILVYWLIVILGVLDIDAFDLDIDAGLDLDADVDASMLDSADGAFSWLAYFNIGKVPVMLFMTVVALTMWVVSVEGNQFLDQYKDGWIAENRVLIAAGLAIPNIIFALHIGKWFVVPIAWATRHRKQVTNLDGKVCKVTSAEVTEKGGRCEMSITDGSHILSARTTNGEVLKKGDAVEIVKHIVDESATKDHYVVTKHQEGDS